MNETPTSHSTTQRNDFEAQFRRLFEAAECKTQIELADVLEIRQSSISAARRRKAVPAEWLLKLFEKKHVNPGWIRTGTGSKALDTSLSQTSAPPDIRFMRRRPSEDFTTEELLAEIMRRVFATAQGQ